MKTLVIFAHPRTDSLNWAIKEAFIEGHTSAENEVRVADLYRDGFNPVLFDDQYLAQSSDPLVSKYRDDISWADTLVFIFPNWWMNMPSILKGFLDKVIVRGFGFTLTEEGFTGLLKGKSAVIITTSGAPEEMVKAAGDPVFHNFKYAVLGTCGITSVYRYDVYSAAFLSDEDIKKTLAGIKDFAKNYKK